MVNPSAALLSMLVLHLGQCFLRVVCWVSAADLIFALPDGLCFSSGAGILVYLQP